LSRQRPACRRRNKIARDHLAKFQNDPMRRPGRREKAKLRASWFPGLRNHVRIFFSKIWLNA
jgi:hypothetical protein